MSTKKPLLEQLQSCPQTPDDIPTYFKETAELLMNNYVISKRGIKYEIVEIEFYLFTPEHPDVITYPRKCRAGQWFFHQSGVDLTFATTDYQFGGILIRGLKKINGPRETKEEDNQVFGPLKCVYKLWDKFNAFEADAAENPIIIPSNENKKPFKINSYPRWTAVREDKEKASAKIAVWKKKVKDEGYNELKKDTEEIFKLVFESEYRFIKEEAIDKDKIWNKYNARIRKT